jgi:beta-lactamase class C
MHAFFRRTACAILAAAILPASALASAASTTLQGAVDAAIRPVMAEYDIPGMAVAVTVDGQSFFFNYGVASREQGTPVSERTLFELGSVSKLFTATLATWAEEQGRLALADHPGKYLAQLHNSPLDRATLRDLGTYTAGDLPLQVPDDVTDMAQMLAWLKAWQPGAAPGTVRAYSNASIGLLGHITAAALGTPFQDAAERVLFPQLGLRHTYIAVPPAARRDYAWGYNRANQPVHVNPGVFDAQAYGVKSTAADVLRFLQVNITPEQLNGPMARAVRATHTGYATVGPMTQGLGWEQYAYPATLARLLEGNGGAMLDAQPILPVPAGAAGGARLFNKTGSTNGFGSYVLFVPEKKIGIVLLANRSYPNAARVTAAWTILQQLVK